MLNEKDIEKISELFDNKLGIERKYTDKKIDEQNAFFEEKLVQRITNIEKA